MASTKDFLITHSIKKQTDLHSVKSLTCVNGQHSMYFSVTKRVCVYHQLRLEICIIVGNGIASMDVLKGIGNKINCRAK